MWARLVVAANVGALLCWSAIAALKITLELVFSRLRLLDAAPSPLQSATTFVVVPVVGVGLLGAVVSLFELAIDAAGSKSKPCFAARARLHRLVALSHSSQTARIVAVAGAAAVPLTLVAVVGGATFFLEHWCSLRCALPSSGREACAAACEWAFKAAAAATLVLASLLAGLVAARSAQRARGGKGAPADEVLFSALDSDFSGALGSRELVSLLGVSVGDAEALIREFDTDKSGSLDVDEFRELAAARKQLMPTVGAPTENWFAGLIVSPSLFTVWARTTTIAFCAALAVPAAVTAAAGGSPEGVVTVALGVGLIASCMFAAIWLGVLFVDHAVDLLHAPRTLALHAAFATVPLALALVDNALKTPFAFALIAFAALNLSGLVVRENQRSIGARAGSNALVWFQLVTAILFAALVGVFLLTYVQSAMGARTNLPDAFAVTQQGESGLGVHTVLGGVDAARGLITLGANSTGGGALASRFPLCLARVQGVSLAQASLLAQAAYFQCRSKDQLTFLSRLFGMEPVGANCRNDVPIKPHDTVVFAHLRNAAGLNVITIRGTHVLDLVDWLADIDVWLEGTLVSLASVGLPSLALWPVTLLSKVTAFVDAQIETSFGPRRRRYYDPVVEYVEALKSSSAEPILIVGHSLGGGLAGLVGAKTHTPAVALSGPGIVGVRHKIGITLDDIHKFTTWIVPSHDVVAQLGVAGGTVHHVECSAHRPDICHMPLQTVCEIVRLCGADGVVDKCDFSFDVKIAAAEQKSEL